MSGWPPHITYALRELGNQYPGDELSGEAFVSSWGGVDDDNLTRAIKQGDGEQDTLLAILAISFFDTPSTENLLIPLLENPYPKVRWVSAYCLGKRRNERVLPALNKFIMDFLPPNEAYVTYDGQQYQDWFYDDWRPRLEQIISEWNRRNEQ